MLNQDLSLKGLFFPFCKNSRFSERNRSASRLSIHVGPEATQRVPKGGSFHQSMETSPDPAPPGNHPGTVCRIVQKTASLPGSL